jgi:hypothetical protein
MKNENFRREQKCHFVWTTWTTLDHLTPTWGEANAEEAAVGDGGAGARGGAER